MQHIATAEAATISPTGRTKVRSVLCGVLLAAALALAPAVAGTPAGAQAASCTPAASAKGEYAGGVYFYTMYTNKCAYKILADKYGDQSGYLGVAALVAG